ncbi:hypothetical protein [Alkalihalobacterium bogoriense]|uniref:hypothetical protein n=1 Tax=Alkalihalobacterium bogoriense TaxID=246272 RepID=UPI00047C9D5C|nr:hypothetical protein [Alkalihalobacterium bogoriense]
MDSFQNYEQQFQSLQKKVYLTKEEKQDMFAKINVNGQSNPFQHRFPYIAAVLSVAFICVILVAPILLHDISLFSTERPAGSIEQNPIDLKTSLVPLILLLLLSVPGFICLYYVFKPKEQDDDHFIELFGFETMVTLLFAFLLWICKWLFPKHMYVTVFRILMLFIGITIFYFLFVFWTHSL